ncbi:MAG TPA: TauD/TfdA family dioxygenase [Candidatus Angelobacter sp.]|jgi:hypothetical protein|nr:TauD/TfdA family dioxygenase [Candidatus Angelobacter sp.]
MEMTDRNIADWPKEFSIFGPPDQAGALPLVLRRPQALKIDLTAWAAEHRDLLQAALLNRGGILFRNFEIESAEEFERFIQNISGGSLPYTERSSPRTQVSGNIYTSTDYPPDQSIFLHNENSYQHTWPLKIFFYCHIPPAHGGETPIADTRKVLALIPPEIRAKFEEKKVMYVRNFGNGLGLPWQTVFQTGSKSKVEQYCQEAGIQCEWLDKHRLRTRHIKDAIAQHPVTYEHSWFNHATFFHPTTLSPKMLAELRLVVDDEDLPYNTFYGDGSPIEAEVLDLLRSAYFHETRIFPWRPSDILLLDNMMVAHGRQPFEGPRQILVGMSELYTPFYN